jgi:GNAT superfamily N-acetyltransferase
MPSLPPRRITASGLDALALMTELLQRARLADPDAGLWEAADFQWWWRTPRRSDALGLLEPMRVEDAWQRRGLARALIAHGLDRLARKGATRMKVSWGSPPGRALYRSAGFRETETSTSYRRDAKPLS